MMIFQFRVVYFNEVMTMTGMDAVRIFFKEEGTDRNLPYTRLSCLKHFTYCLIVIRISEKNC
jgi:hypothetical protein